MPDHPRPESFPKIRRALRFYLVASNITGVLLLLLTVEMILKYAFGVVIEAFGPFGALALVPEATTGLDLSRWILIVHGWFYVVYLVACYLLWQLMRWPLWYLLALAAGGVVPFLSFVTETIMGRKVRRELAGFEAEAAERDAEERRLRRVEASLSDEERAALDAEVAAEVAGRRDDGDAKR